MVIISLLCHSNAGMCVSGNLWEAIQGSNDIAYYVIDYIESSISCLGKCVGEESIGGDTR